MYYGFDGRSLECGVKGTYGINQQFIHFAELMIGINIKLRNHREMAVNGHKLHTTQDDFNPFTRLDDIYATLLSGLTQ